MYLYLYFICICIYKCGTIWSLFTSAMLTTNRAINQTSPAPPPLRGLFHFHSRFVWNVEKDLFETFHSIPPSGVFAKRNGDGLTIRGLLFTRYLQLDRIPIEMELNAINQTFSIHTFICANKSVSYINYTKLLKTFDGINGRLQMYMSQHIILFSCQLYFVFVFVFVRCI